MEIRQINIYARPMTQSYLFRQMALLVSVVLVSIVLTSPLQLLADTDRSRQITLLFTNDFESAFDPIPAYWDDRYEYLGGAAQMATLIEQYRQKEALVFLFDAGDIFTGVLSQLTEGAVPMEMMITMGYDAMAIGNHEFEYGWETFARVKNRLPFPVLGANLFYRDSGLAFAQPYAIIERSGFRMGVIGVMGQDAATAIIPSHIAGLDVRDPIPIVNKLVQLLRNEVDLIVVLTHQGKTAPMQTDDEAHPEIQRGIEADKRLAAAVPGIDVIFSGHADSGTEEPFVSPDNGTLIMQTYGQGTRLGLLKLRFSDKTGAIISHEGRLIPVVSNDLTPDSIILKKLQAYRRQYPELQEIVTYANKRLTRLYNEESDLGNLYADIIREETSAMIGLMPSGALRKDLPAGPIPLGDLLDSFPFTDKIIKLHMTGEQLLRVLEQSLTLERGILQVSGLSVHYDLDKPLMHRVIKVDVEGKPLKTDTVYTIATVEILAQGGDLYRVFLEAERIDSPEPMFSDVLRQRLKSREVIDIPKSSRLISKH